MPDAHTEHCRWQRDRQRDRKRDRKRKKRQTIVLVDWRKKDAEGERGGDKRKETL